MRAPGAQTHPAVAEALKDCRRAFWSIAVFSGIVNLLMLAGPLYMLQVYDRVLGSRNVPTLVALTIFLIGAFAFQGLLDTIRGRIVVRVATLLDRDLSTSVHAAVVRIASQSRSASDAHQPVRDLDQIRAFFTSAGPIAIVDLPWTPLFLALCFLIHPWLGMLALAGSIVLLVLTFMTERASRTPSRETSRIAGERTAMIEADRSNCETAIAMGMTPTLAVRWTSVNQRYLGAIGRSSDAVGTYGSISKVFRMLLQSAILGLGAYLVIRQEMTGGAMIAASIMVGRALAPVEIAIANWRNFIAARVSVRRLSETLARLGGDKHYTVLPPPSRGLTVENLAVGIPGAPKPILTNVQFQLMPGEALGIIGPSGSGKTSLVRTLLGIWPIMNGEVRLDGAAINQWHPHVLGGNVGFVSQAVDLFGGTIAENVARMALEPDSGMTIKAARAAGAHDMILRIPSGYDARIGDNGTALSAGQRQRIALARALYGDPFLIVLDEPNSNLDTDGDAALHAAIAEAKARKAIVIIIAHRPSALVHCDKVLYLANGIQQAYGPREEVMNQLAAAMARPTTEPTLHAVREASAGASR